MATGSRHESYLFVSLHILMRLLLLCLLLFPPIISSLDADFPALWELHANEAAPTHIPNVAHFIYVFVQEVGWTEYIAIRSARDFLHVDTINIWTPPGAVFPGEMWERILALPSVVVRTVDMPDSVFGHQVMKPAHVADLVRLRVMYEEGGIYMDTNLVAFRSSDDVLFNTSLRPTIMAIEGNVGLCNALIISQPRSPFLQRWMEKYTKFDDDEWNDLSVVEPYSMYEAGDPDISVLDDHAWFYPMYNDNSRGFYTMWLGKSWHDIDRSRGVHFWAWPDSPIPHMLDPQTARTIDTPLFCHLRKLFDDLDGDGYVATPPALNPNCSVVRVEGLVEHARGLFADFGFEGDKEDIKWVDGSGNRLHGWAPVGTARVEDRGTGGRCRHFDAGSWAVLPVPADYDAREGSVVVSLRLDDVDWSQVAWEGREVLLAKIRVENRGQILLDLVRRSISSHETELRFRWETEDDDIESMNDRVDWYSVASIPLSTRKFHLLVVTWDRTFNGSISVFFDDRRIAETAVSLIGSPRVAYEVWLNAKYETNLDCGFRGSIERLRLYTNALSDADVKQEALYTQHSPMLPDYIHPVMRKLRPILRWDVIGFVGLCVVAWYWRVVRKFLYSFPFAATVMHRYEQVRGQ